MGGMTLNDRRESVIQNGVKAIAHMQESAEKAGLSDMSLDEINAEIAAARAEQAGKGIALQSRLDYLNTLRLREKHPSDRNTADIIEYIRESRDHDRF